MKGKNSQMKPTSFFTTKKNEGKKLENEARLQTNEFFHYKKNERKKLANEASQ